MRARHWLAWRHGEPELRLVPRLSDPARLALDVGANFGPYSATMRRHARLCHAFEPNPDYAWIYRRVLGDVVLHPVALSDRTGTASFHLPVAGGRVQGGWGTLERLPDFAGERVESFEVELQRLDDLGLDPVGMIKIDVEGHEMAVLRGGRETLRRDRPAILVECEERHRPGTLEELFGWMREEDYRGFFLRGGALRPLAEFDPHKDQASGERGAPVGSYIMNFLFLGETAQAQRLGIAST